MSDSELPLSRRFTAELLGTFALVFAGTGACIVDAVTGGTVGHAGIALTFGLVVLGVIQAVGDVSGAHINPAVTLGFFAARRFPGSLVLPYLAAQVAGALLASGALRLLFPDANGLGATLPAAGAGQSFAFEVLLTFFLMFVIFSVSSGAREKGLMAGVAIGGTVTLSALYAGPVSGASTNPARSLGPALVGGQTEALWIYLAAPVLGALLAIPASRVVHGPKCCQRGDY